MADLGGLPRVEGNPLSEYVAGSRLGIAGTDGVIPMSCQYHYVDCSCKLTLKSEICSNASFSSTEVLFEKMSLSN